MWSKFLLLFYTMIHLKPIQLFYQLWYRLKSKWPIKPNYCNSYDSVAKLQWVDGIFNLKTYIADFKFRFLNIEHRFKPSIDWNFNLHKKLWTYNLNYFDFLNQQTISRIDGLALMKHYVNAYKGLKDGKEPYPSSLRIINWIKFIAKHKINDTQILEVLREDSNRLLNNLEYNLLGNHLLENAFSLLFGAYYFQDDKLYNKSKDLLITELNGQVLKDGAHFELSPMYHQIIYSRLLDCIQLIKLNDFWKKDDLFSFLEAKAGLMNSWLQNITYNSGEIPMVNDATYNIAPSSTQLFSYAKKLGIINQKIPLSDSGYRKICTDNYELLIDVGNVGPDYQPGHAHSDTFNFELIKDGNPIFVDTGISTYEKNNKRQEERSTHSHNTVKIGSKDQTQVWGGFRLAKRAKINHLREKPNLIEASHDGYLSDGYKHTRSFLWGGNFIVLNDKINRPTSNKARAYFHFHSSLTKPFVNGNTIILESLGVSIEFEKASNIYIEEYQLSAGFNKSLISNKIVVKFDDYLKTSIRFQ